MNWQDFYLVAFLVGFLLSAISFLFGFAHIPHLHGPHLHLHGHHGGLKIGKSGVSPFNFATIAAFLAWFGGTGYLLERYASLWVFFGLGLSAVSGIFGAWIVFWFMAKLAADSRPMDGADYEMVGVFGKVASPIRSGGTGEMIYARDGARCASPVRSEDGTAIPRDTEVVVTRFEKGIAYVRRWEEMSGERS